MSLARKVFYNTAVQIVGKFFAIAISVGMVMVLTRYLGTEGYGDYATILTYLGFAGIVVDMGFYSITVREISKPKANIPRIVGNVLSLRTFLSILLFGGAIGLIFLLPYSMNIKLGVTIASLAYLFISLRQIGVSVFQAKLKMGNNVIIDLVTRIVNFVLVFVLVWQGYGLLAVLGALIIANGLGFILTMILARRFTKVSFRIDKKIWKSLFWQAVPMAIALVLIKIYFQVDIIFLSFMKGSHDVGIYSAAYKVLEVLITVPAMFVASVLPSLSFHVVKKHFKRIKHLFQRSFDVLALMAFPVTVGGILLAKPIMKFVAGDQFEGSEKVLVWILIALSFIFLNTLMGNAMLAYHKQHRLIWQGVLGVVVNVGLNLILIPRYSYLGAAAATLITEGLVLILMTVMVGRELKLWPRLINPLKILVATGVMGIVVYFLAGYNLVFPIVAGGVVYFALLYLFKVVDKQLIRTILLKPVKN
ncbi:flippase [Patescibacteria group bacterium]